MPIRSLFHPSASGLAPSTHLFIHLLPCRLVNSNTMKEYFYEISVSFHLGKGNKYLQSPRELKRCRVGLAILSALTKCFMSKKATN